MDFGAPYGANSSRLANVISWTANATFINKNRPDGSRVSAYMGIDYGDHEGALVRFGFGAQVSSRVSRLFLIQ